MKRILLALALLLPTTVWAQPNPPPAISQLQQNPAGARSALQLPSVLSDIGVPLTRPFGLLCAGQSNARGQSYEGSKVVQSGIYILNAVTGATSVVPAAFGTAPLNGTTPNTSSVTTDPALSYNNQCVHFANSLRLSGRLPASRSIVIVPNYYPGQSIFNWIGNTPGTFTPGTFFTDLQASLAIASATYPGFRLDFAIWDQGESDTAATPYSSQALYTQGFQTLLAAFRALPQWANSANGDGFDTNLTMVELARFADNGVALRNDAIDSFANGALDPHVTVTPTFGALETTIASNVGPHYHGASLAGLMAQRDFEAWRDGSLNGGYRSALQNANGSAFSFPNSLTISSGTVTLSPDQLKSGAAITATGGTYILPDASTVPNGTQIFINAVGTLGLSCILATPCVGGISTENNLAGTGPTVSSGNFVLYSLANKWFVQTVSPRTGGFNFRIVSYTSGAAVTLDTTNSRGAVGFANNNVITLPASTAGQWYGVMVNPAGTAATLNSIDGSSTIKLLGGKLVASYSIAPGQMIMMQTIGNLWVVTSDNLQPGGSLLLPKLASAPAAAPGAGFSMLFTMAGTTGGSCKLMMQSGTSATAVLVLDNVGAGC